MPFAVSGASTVTQWKGHQRVLGTDSFFQVFIRSATWTIIKLSARQTQPAVREDDGKKEKQPSYAWNWPVILRVHYKLKAVGNAFLFFVVICYSRTRKIGWRNFEYCVCALVGLVLSKQRFLSKAVEKFLFCLSDFYANRDTLFSCKQAWNACKGFSHSEKLGDCLQGKYRYRSVFLLRQWVCKGVMKYALNYD